MAEKTSGQKALIQKIVEIGLANRYIQKGGTNTGVGGGYKFVQDAAVIDKYGDSLLEAGIAVVPQHTLVGAPIIIERDGKSAQVLTTIACKFVFTSGENEIAVETIGQGMDTGDKGAFKAMTGGRKYAYMQLFQVVTGDDPEKTRQDEKDAGDEPTARDPGAKATTAQIGRMFGLAKKAGIDTSTDDGKKLLQKIVLEATGKFSSKQLTMGDMDKVYKTLETDAALVEASGGEIIGVA